MKYGRNYLYVKKQIKGGNIWKTMKKYGSITISPTAITDKEQTYDLHQRSEDGCDMLITVNGAVTNVNIDNVSITSGTVAGTLTKILNGEAPEIRVRVFEHIENYLTFAEEHKAIGTYYSGHLYVKYMSLDINAHALYSYFIDFCEDGELLDVHYRKVSLNP